MRHSIALCAVFAALVFSPAASADPPPSPALREADLAARTADLAGQRLLRLLDQTRLAGDRRRVACVDGKLSEVNSFARMILVRRDRLVSAEARGDRGEAGRERTIIRHLVGQLRRIEREGRACVGQIEASGTRVEVDVAPDVPREDLRVVTRTERPWR